MITKVNVGLIGAGRIGRVHAENLAHRIPEVNRVVVANVFLEAAEKCVATYQISSAAQGPPTIFNDETIDVVVICSSTATHAQFITPATQAGKHIFCEKPTSYNLAKIDQALTAEYGPDWQIIPKLHQNLIQPRSFYRGSEWK